MAKLLTNSGDPDQMPHYAASDLGLYCLPVTLLGVSRLKWVIEKVSVLSYFSTLAEKSVSVLSYFSTLVERIHFSRGSLSKLFLPPF